ncbi:hypothetical protein BV25DRAFT_1863798 [Artomyces pyxidatus]|uniref:Uncharacterized protein n=1 Tax=Artomyces pyxidatus TaxID=48021 RepID=A0ACB8SKN8_9AGAM|nr:hypothetical protein BV25DRAFT_1863798 [Artomyces pyxidatus]
MDSSRAEYPRISVESRQDWQRVKANFAQAVYASFDERLAAAGLTASRASLAPYVQKFIDETFEKAKPNVRVNGQNLEELEELNGDPDVEPFDEPLDKEIWSLSDQRLQWDREVGNERRTKPQEVATLLENMFAAQRAADLEEADDDIDEDEHAESDVDGETLAEAENTFGQLASLAESLHQTVQTQQERTTRLKVVEKEIKALKS